MGGGHDLPEMLHALQIKKEQAMNRVKPCPFCGQAAAVEAIFGDHLYAHEDQKLLRNSYYVSCVDKHSCRAMIGNFDKKSRAIKAWNKRKGSG